jgi:hypothetical protein
MEHNVPICQENKWTVAEFLEYVSDYYFLKEESAQWK